MAVLAQGYWEQLKHIQNNQGKEVTKIPSTEPFIEINLDSREVKLPLELQDFLSIEKDHRAETIFFRVDRYFDDVDLTTTTIVVEYVNAIGQSRIYPVILQDWTSQPGKILFGWCLGKQATRYAGTIKFAVHFYSVDQEKHMFTYSLNTLPAEGTILYGISGDTAEEDNDEQDYNDYEFASETIEDILQTVNDNRVRWIDV